MRYQEFLPTDPLAQYVKCFWLLESSFQETGGQQRILPDGCTEIVFHLADPFNQLQPDGTPQKQPLTLLVGQMSHHLLIEPTGRVQLLGVRFWPAGIYPFLTVPQNEISGRILALDAAEVALARELECRVGYARSGAEALEQVEVVLLDRLKRYRGDDESVAAGVTLILRNAGRLSIGALAHELGLGLRTLDRRVKTRVGLSPKTLCRIARFQQVLRLVHRENGNPNWAQIALECGFFDQAHFVKEFKVFAGEPPTSYCIEQHVMSDHFTQSD